MCVGGWGVGGVVVVLFAVVKYGLGCEGGDFEMREFDRDCNMDGWAGCSRITGMQHTEGFLAGPHLGVDTCVDPVFL